MTFRVAATETSAWSGRALIGRAFNAKFIIFGTKFIIFGTKFISCNAKFINFNTNRYRGVRFHTKISRLCTKNDDFMPNK